MPDDTKPAAATREQLDISLAALPGEQNDPEYVVRGMRGWFGDLFTADDEAKVRELVKLTAPDAPAPNARKGRTVRRQVTTPVINPVTSLVADVTKIIDTDEAECPVSVTLAAPYAFYDDDGVLHSWGQGCVVSDPADIACLVDRGVIFLPE